MNSAINHSINHYEIDPFLTASQAPNGLLTDVGMVRKGFGNEKIVDKSILFFSKVSLSIFSLEALYISWV